MKALVISPQPFFSPRGTPFSVYYRTLVMAESGIEVDLLTYGEGQDVDIPGVRIIRTPRFGFLGPTKVGPSHQKLFLDMFILIWTLRLLLTRRYDFVHAHEEAVFFCRFLKPIFRFKLVYDMHSSLPQQLTNFQFTRCKPIIDLFRRLEDSCLTTADAIITICPDLSRYVKGLIKDDGKHLMIENSIFEPVKLRPASVTDLPFRPKVPVSPDTSSDIPIGIPPETTIGTPIGTPIDTPIEAAIDTPVELPGNKRFVVYAGTLEPYQGIGILLEAFKVVTEEVSDVYLIVAGGSEKQVHHYSGLSDRIGLNGNCRFTGRVAQRTAKLYTGLASVLVSPRSEGTNTPLKVYEQIASGIPLVATNIYPHTQVLNSDISFLVDPEPKSMARGIIDALRVDGPGCRIAANARKYYDKKYSRPIYEGKMRQLMRILSNCAE